MKNLEKRIAESEIVWNDNVSDRGEWFELYAENGQLMVARSTRFSFRYEDQYDGHGEAEYGVRLGLLTSLLEALNDIKDKEIKVVFCYNYDYSGDETFD